MFSEASCLQKIEWAEGSICMEMLYKNKFKNQSTLTSTYNQRSTGIFETLISIFTKTLFPYQKNRKDKSFIKSYTLAKTLFLDLVHMHISFQSYKCLKFEKIKYQKIKHHHYHIAI